MPNRDFWQEHIDLVYNGLDETLYTQEEIDDNISAGFAIFAGYTDNPDDIPNDFQRRKREFYDPTNLLRWIRDGGIPLSSVYIRRHIANDGDYKYVAHISPTS